MRRLILIAAASIALAGSAAPAAAPAVSPDAFAHNWQRIFNKDAAAHHWPDRMVAVGCTTWKHTDLGCAVVGKIVRTHAVFCVFFVIAPPGRVVSHEAVSCAAAAAVAEGPAA